MSEKILIVDDERAIAQVLGTFYIKRQRNR